MEVANVETILVVDDDPTICMVASAHLRQAGYQVQIAGNGQAMLEMLEDVQPELILLDVDMPVLDGFQACQQLKAQTHTKHIPVLMMTGLEGDSSIEKAYSVGATDFIAKPVNWLLLKQRIRFMLRATRAIKELAISESRLEKAQAIAHLGYWRWDVSAQTGIVSKQLSKMLGKLPEEITSQASLLSAIAESDRTMIADIMERTKLKPITLPSTLEVRTELVNGELKVFHLQSELEWSAEHKIQAIQGTIQDVTDRVKAEEKIQYLSRYDRLTGLPNRDSFAAALESMAQYCGHGQRNGVIFLIDLDHFVRVNDLYGHHIGDYVLVESGRRVKQFLQEMIQRAPNVKGECCRWGGDKFAISLCCSDGERDYAQVASALLASLSEPYHIHDCRVHLTACLGYVAVEGGQGEIESLVRSAENALRFAKRQGANVLRCYDSTMNESTERRMTLEAELRKALAEQQLRVVYQPRVNAATQKICGAEALLRWHHPLIGEVSPVEFIPIMEELGIIQEVGAWVFEEACKQLKAWYQQGHTEFVMSINLSAVQFRDVTLPAQIQAIISRIEVSPERVEVELTETAIMDDVGKTQRMLFALKELGVRVAIDDFGTGHSSLSYLRSFPIDTLKVDRSFIRELPGSAEDSSLAAAIIAMARSLDLRVVAEGVEYRGQADFLLEKQCDELQGFLFSKPVSPAFFSTLLETFNKD